MAFVAYFTIAGAFGDAVDASVQFPLFGIQHGASLGDRVNLLGESVGHRYGLGGVVVVLGLLALMVEATVVLVGAFKARRRPWDEPVISVLVPFLVVQSAYTATDFQGPPDLYPFLPLASLGLAAIAARLTAAFHERAVARRGVAVAVAVFVAAGLVGSAIVDRNHVEHDLVSQNTVACGIQRMTGSINPLWAFGNPTALVLTGRTNPDRFINVGSGLGAWKIDHLSGGIRAWQEEMLAAEPSVVAFGAGDIGLNNVFVKLLLNHGYSARYLGSTRLLVTTAALLRARHYVDLTAEPTQRPRGLDGKRLDPCSP